MTIIDEIFLATYRGPGACWICGKGCSRREPHHVIAKGMGGGRRLDIAINLVCVGSTLDMQCECHGKADSAEGKELCLKVLGNRFGVEAAVIVDVCSFILALDKHASPDAIRDAIAANWRPDSPRSVLAVETLQAAGKIGA